MLLDYSNHRRWIWFTSTLLLLALGVYAGLGDFAARGNSAPVGGALLATAFVLAALRLAGRRKGWFEERRGLSWLTGGLVVIGGGAGLLLLGVSYGRRWAAPDGPSAASVVGMWFGIVGSACMVFAGLLSAHRLVPSGWWLGGRTWWLKGHIWLGLLSVPLIYFHSAGRLGGPLEVLLWVLLLLVVGSGAFGLALQQFLPNRITTRLGAEVPYEQIPRLCLVLRQKADALIDRVCPPPAPDPARAELRKTYVEVIRPFFGPDYDRRSPLARPSQREVMFQGLRALPGLEGAEKELGQLQTLCDDRRQMGEQERLHHWLHVWLFAHVPLSVALLALGVLHAVASLYY